MHDTILNQEMADDGQRWSRELATPPLGQHWSRSRARHQTGRPPVSRSRSNRLGPHGSGRRRSRSQRGSRQRRPRSRSAQRGRERASRRRSRSTSRHGRRSRSRSSHQGRGRVSRPRSREQRQHVEKRRSQSRATVLERDGFAVLDGFLREAECDELRAAGLELTRRLPDGPPTIFSTTEPESQQLKDKYFLESNDKISYFYEKDAIDANGKLQVDPAISLNKVGHALHLLHPIFRCYTYSDRVKSVCRSIGLADPAVVQSMYIYKNPGVGGEVIAHQDITYLYTEPIPPIGFWIALEDATIQNGCLWMARGSHKSGVHRRMLRSPEDREKIIYDKPVPVYPESSFTPVPVSKGTCILIHGNVVHRSAPNRSEASRHAYTFHVVEKKDNNYSADNWLQEGENAPFLSLYTTSQLQ